jgi:hypothetical protein
MALYVYETATGRLVSWGPSDDTPVASDEVLLERGYSKATGLAALDETHAWDEATKTVVVVPAPVYPRDIPTSRFVLAFTPTELEAVRNSSDPIVKQLWIAATVVPEVDMNRQSTIDGVGYLELIGLIGEGRAAQILATE